MPKSSPQNVKPYYVYMMKGKENRAHTNSTRKSKKKTPPIIADDKVYIHVGKSRAPVRKVQRHNRLSVRIVTNRKLMTRVGGNWRLEEWFGPFSTRTKARSFQRIWASSIRRNLMPPKPTTNETKHYSSRVPISSARLAASCKEIKDAPKVH